VINTNLKCIIKLTSLSRYRFRSIWSVVRIQDSDSRSTDTTVTINSGAFKPCQASLFVDLTSPNKDNDRNDE
jgi:hypothetical protein